MSQHGIGEVTVSRIEGETQSNRQDIVAVEEPLEVRIGYGSELREQKSIAGVIPGLLLPVFTFPMYKGLKKINEELKKRKL